MVIGMWNLCLGRLIEVTEGEVTFGSLPPLAGDYQPIRRIVIDSRQVQTGDVYWEVETGLDGRSTTTSRAEHALIRGALGAVVVGRRVEPWAGRFVLYVDDAIERLVSLIRCCPEAARSKTFVWGQTDLGERASCLDAEVYCKAAGTCSMND